MSKFENLPEDYMKPITLVFDLLQKCGIILCDENVCWYNKIILPTTMKICVLTYITSLSLYFSRLFKGNMDIYELMYIFPVYVALFQSMLRGINTVINKNKIISLILDLGDVWRTGKLNEVQKRKQKEILKKVNISYTAYNRITAMASWQYILAPLMQTLLRKFILQQESKLLLPFACSFPFKTDDNWINYAMAYIFQIYSMYGLIYYYLSSEILMITLTGLLSTEFVLLQEDFINIKRPSIQETNDYGIIELTHERELKHLIKRHQKLIKLTEQLDDIFNKLIFINLSSSTVIIGFFAVAAKIARGAVDMINNFAAVLTLMVPLFSLCYFSELLKQSSGGIAAAAYNSKWYIGSTKYKKMLYFVIRRAQHPSCLTSMKYNPISLNTFSAVLSTTWSYFSLASSLIDG